jgi:hypothetical protein
LAMSAERWKRMTFHTKSHWKESTDRH